MLPAALTVAAREAIHEAVHTFRTSLTSEEAVALVRYARQLER